MKTELYNYDVYPKVVCAGVPAEITVRPLGLHSAFPQTVTLRVQPIEERTYPRDNVVRGGATYTLSPDEDGCLRFTHAFEGEQQHFLSIMNGEKEQVRLNVYSVFEDLAGCIPLMGDLHLHSIRSDGREDPCVVAAHLRRQGYDFIALTDHRNFSGSLETIDAYKDVPIEMNLMTGEEIHLPDCFLHCVHIGGRYSVNAMVESVRAEMEKKNPGVTARFPEAWTKMEGSDFPGTMTDEEFIRTIEAYAETLGPIPADIPRFTYAGFHWICNEIRRAGGLAIFPHPYWIHDNGSIGGCANHGSDRLTQYLFETRPFDAFEVLGGENYFEQNGFQAVHYYEARAKGLNFPVVGSSDSHSSVNNRNAFIAETICFAKSNDTEGIQEAIRAGRSVALDTISAEFRLVGDFRLVKYACFLMNEYFPLHRDACREQGRAMKEYYCGCRDEGAAMLQILDGRIARMWKKYFAF